MGVVRRFKRTARDPSAIGRHWDNGWPPPQAASDPANSDEVVGVYFFHKYERTVKWSGTRHPFDAEWRAAMQQGRRKASR